MRPASRPTRAIPIRIDDQVVGGIAAYFDRPVGGARPRSRRARPGRHHRLDHARQLPAARAAAVGSERPLPDAVRGVARRAARRAPRIGRSSTPTTRPSSCSRRDARVAHRPAAHRTFGAFDRRSPRRRAARHWRLATAIRAQSTGIRRDGDRFPIDVRRHRASSSTASARLLRPGPRPDRAGAPPGRAGPGPEDGGDRPARVGRRPRAQQPAGVDPRVQPAHPSRSRPCPRTCATTPTCSSRRRPGPGGSSRTCSTSRGSDRRNATRPRSARWSTACSRSSRTASSLGAIEVDVDIPADLPPVELDRGQLQQVLVNLTHNAIYAIRNGRRRPPPDLAPRWRGRPTRSASGSRSWTTDRASPPEHVARLFEAFFTTKPASDGTGLGLSVSYGIIAAHGGELRYGPSAWRSRRAPSRSTCRSMPVVDDGDGRRPPRSGAGHRRPADGRRRGRRRAADRRPRRPRSSSSTTSRRSARSCRARAGRRSATRPVVTATAARRLELRATATVRRGPVRPPDAGHVRHRRLRGDRRDRPGPAPDGS